jgi:sigma-B regulation protein RsbU (phosphoserine phosphatase)
MILANTIGMAIFALILSNLIKERKTASERDRYRRELERRAYEMEIAGGIQQSFLPESPPRIEGVELAAVNLPAREVGGDFYDFIPVSQDKWGLVIADVSGKGVPAALFMALSRTLVRANAVGNPTVSGAIRRANDLIVEDDRANMFVTLFYSVLDPKRKTLSYVNAGHNPPVMLRREGRDIMLLAAKGIALGVMPNIELEEREISLREGDVVVLYTDGVTEAINDKEEQFGQQRLIQLIDEGRGLPAQEIVTRIQQGVTAFSAGQPQFDDITIMVLKVA